MELEVSDEEAEEQHAQTARQPPQRHHSSVAAVGRGTSRPLCEWRQGAGRGSSRLMDTMNTLLLLKYSNALQLYL